MMTDKIIDMTDMENVEEDTNAIIEELHDDLERMMDAQKKKLEIAREQLVMRAEAISAKFKTANGVDLAYSTLEQYGAADLKKATIIASCMSDLAADLATKIKTIEIEKMDEICEDLYDKKFADHADIDGEDMAHQMCVLQLCQEIGASAQDIKDFMESSDEQIAEMNTKITEMLSKE